MKLNLRILGHFYFCCQTWNSKKYIIYLAIVSGRKRQSMIIIFVSLIFRQHNNLGKGIQFNIFRSFLNRYFRLLFSKQAVSSVLKNYNIAPWGFLIKFSNHNKGSPQNAMMDPFKQYSNVTTAYFRSGKIKAVIRFYPGFMK